MNPMQADGGDPSARLTRVGSIILVAETRSATVRYALDKHMLRRLTIHNRSSQELRELARERRVLAASQEPEVKALFLQEAKLLEFYADVRDWVKSADRSRAGQRRSGERMGSGHRGDSGSGPVPLADLGRLARCATDRLALGPVDQEVLLAAAGPRHVLKGEYLIAEGDDHSSLMILCGGMAKATRVMPDGNQQIVAIFVAGDMLNAGDLTFRRSRISISVLTPAISLSIPLPVLQRLMEERPAIARMLWRETAAQAAIQREWMIGIGRRTAQARLAHFLCEMSCRLQLFNPTVDEGFDLPLIQQDLGDILGLSAVHVNRVLQSLRGEGLIEFNRGRLEILDKAGLCAVAEFDGQYLSGSMHPEVGST
jgi:CRP-like cAMP-binding protein